MRCERFKQANSDLSRIVLPALCAAAFLLASCRGVNPPQIEQAFNVAASADIFTAPSKSTLLASYQRSVPLQQTACAATANNPVNIRSGPAQNYTIIGALEGGSYIQAIGRSADNTWLTVNIAGGQGWIFREVVLLVGECNSLPLVPITEATPVILPQTLPVASNDENSSYFEVDRNSEGQFRQSISYPAGDRTDRILMVASNLADSAADYNRIFTVTLNCRGVGTEYVRWGTSSNAMLPCGGGLATSLNYEFNQQSFIVRIPENSGQSYIDYTLRAMPAAPADEEKNPLAFSADRDGGSQMVNEISFPNGDHTDRVVMHVANLTQSSLDYYRVFNLTLVCQGTGIEYVRWGTPDNPALGCGSTMPVLFSYALNQQSFIVTLPDSSGQSYISYAIRAAPVAPDDAQAFYLEVDRDGAHQVGDVVSFPDGDSSDVIQMTVTDLTAVSPDNYREFILTLQCTGTGVENVRWGAPENPTQTCGSTISVPFIYNFNRRILIVTLPQGSGQSFVNYRLSATVNGIPTS